MPDDKFDDQTNNSQADKLIEEIHARVLSKLPKDDPYEEIENMTDEEIEDLYEGVKKGFHRNCGGELMLTFEDENKNIVKCDKCGESGEIQHTFSYLFEGKGGVLKKKKDDEWPEIIDG